MSPTLTLLVLSILPFDLPSTFIKTNGLKSKHVFGVPLLGIQPSAPGLAKVLLANTSPALPGNNRQCHPLIAD